MRLVVIFFLIWTVMILPLVTTQRTVPYLTRKDLKDLFGSEDCIEGKLLTRASPLDQLTGQDVYVIMNPVPGSESEKSEYDPSVDEAQEVSSKQQENGEDKEVLSKIHELSVYNSIQSEYTLIKEEGPPHRRKFTIALKLGDEHYVGEGTSIKRAKRDAASQAFQDTKYDQPIRKKKKKTQSSPLEELEVLANRQGNEVVFKTETHQHHQWTGNKTIEISQRPHSDGADNYQIVFLNIGELEFIGDGDSIEAARDDAIDQALVVLRKELIEDKERNKEEKFDVEASKSPISRVHEIGQRRIMEVSFALTGESGSPHNKVFVTTCTVGHLTTEAEGMSKKESKQNAAKLMLVELEKLPFMSFSTNTKLKQSRRRKKKKPKILRPSVDVLSSVMNVLNFGSSDNSDQLGESSSSQSKKSSNDQSTKTFDGSSQSGGQSKKSTNDKSTNRMASGKPRHQLINLSKKLGFRFEFVDFKKGDDDVLSFVSLKTDPQKVCYGISLSQQKARDISALAALKLLHDLEFDKIEVAEKEPAEFETLRDRADDPDTCNAEPKSVILDVKGL